MILPGSSKVPAGIFFQDPQVPEDPKYSKFSTAVEELTVKKSTAIYRYYTKDG